MSFPPHIQILHSAAAAFGGWSQFRFIDIGRCIIGHCNNNGMVFTPKEFSEVISAVEDRWPDLDIETARKEIIDGMDAAVDDFRNYPNTAARLQRVVVGIKK